MANKPTAAQTAMCATIRTQVAALAATFREAAKIGVEPVLTINTLPAPEGGVMIREPEIVSLSYKPHETSSPRRTAKPVNEGMVTVDEPDAEA